VSAAPGTTAGSAPAAGDGKAVQALAAQRSCTGCHAAEQKLVGPSWSDIARKHLGKAEYLAGKIRSGGSGTWGAIPMPPQNLSDTEVQRIANWLASGAQP
jgi:cytochrome c